LVIGWVFQKIEISKKWMGFPAIGLRFPGWVSQDLPIRVKYGRDYFLDRRSRIVNWIINRRSFDKCQILLIIIIILLCKIISDIQDQNHQQQNRVSQQFEQSSVDQIGKFIISGPFRSVSRWVPVMQRPVNRWFKI